VLNIAIELMAYAMAGGGVGAVALVIALRLRRGRAWNTLKYDDSIKWHGDGTNVRSVQNSGEVNVCRRCGRARVAWERLMFSFGLRREIGVWRDGAPIKHLTRSKPRQEIV
jgi:hypothetical protein